RILMRVDLPEPLPPQSAWISPGRTSRSTPLSARVPGNSLERLRTTRVGATPSPLDVPVATSVSLADAIALSPQGHCGCRGAEACASNQGDPDRSTGWSNRLWRPTVAA